MPPVVFEESGWFLVRAVTNNQTTYRYASTGPFYVEFDDLPRISRQATQFFLDWLDELEKRGWLSEKRFVEQLTTVRRRKYGADRIVRELREKGVSGEVLESSRAALLAGEIDAARAVWNKKFGQIPGTLEEKARQQRFLAGRGFSAEAVRAVLKKSRDD